MENQQQNAAPQGAAKEAALTFEQWLEAMVAAGKMAAFTSCYDNGDKCRLVVSLRAAVWLLQALEGHEAEGLTICPVVVEYQYGERSVVLGTYPLGAIRDYNRGRRCYLKRKLKDATRASNRAKRARLAAEKGGATL